MSSSLFPTNCPYDLVRTVIGFAGSAGYLGSFGFTGATVATGGKGGDAYCYIISW